LREVFWSFLVDCKIAERYYWHYAHHSRFWNNTISVLCLITSASSISAWYFWKACPLLWAIFLGVAQIVSVCKPIFPFSKRLVAGRYIRQDIESILTELEYIWGSDGSGISDEEFRNRLSEYKARYDSSENRFSTDDLFRPNHKVHEKAQNDAVLFFKSRYGVGAE